MKASVLTRVKVETVRAGGAGGAGDNDSNNIIINSFLERIRFRELITYIRVSYV